jgi:hypothetical protein
MRSRCKIMMRAGTLCRLISLSPSEVSITAEQTESLSKELRPKAKCEFLYTGDLDPAFETAVQPGTSNRCTLGACCPWNIVHPWDVPPNELRTRQVAVLEG